MLMVGMDLKLNHKFLEIQDRWSDISPEEGTEECICTLCGEIIGACEEDPRWQESPLHKDAEDDFCPGCALCEIAVRLWDGKNREMRFHPHCFNELLK